MPTVTSCGYELNFLRALLPAYLVTTKCLPNVPRIGNYKTPCCGTRRATVFLCGEDARHCASVKGAAHVWGAPDLAFATIVFFNRGLHHASEKPTVFPTVWATAYVQSNCVATRDAAAATLMSASPVHALGKCMSTQTHSAAGAFPTLTTNTYNRYAFALTLEHTVEGGYCTEKAVIAAEGGAIPIYAGDATILCQLLNCQRVIMWDHGKAVAIVTRLLANRTEYKRMWSLPRFNRRAAKHMLSRFAHRARMALPPP